jgi:signal transduction histidine kinase
MSEQADLITAKQLNQRLPIGNAHDELGRMAQVLNRLLTRLEDSFAQLRRFTSDVSHELRTPLAAIRSVGEVGLQDERSPGEYREIIGSMLEEVSRLTDMVETLLIISRADAGQVQLQATQFALPELIEESTDLVQILAEEKHQKLSVNIQEKVQVMADRPLLRLAIVNILHNAVRYSPERAPIEVSLSPVVGATNEQRWVEFGVVDSGPGIPKEEHVKVFDRFYRTDKARSREEGGVGLGLAIAKWAVEINGGHIGVQTTVSGSCRFFIQLPVLS